MNKNALNQALNKCETKAKKSILLNIDTDLYDIIKYISYKEKRTITDILTVIIKEYTDKYNNINNI